MLSAQQPGPFFSLRLDKDYIEALKKLHQRIQSILPYPALQTSVETASNISIIQQEDKSATKQLKIMQRAPTQLSKQTLLYLIFLTSGFDTSSSIQVTSK